MLVFSAHYSCHVLKYVCMWCVDATLKCRVYVVEESSACGSENTTLNCIYTQSIQSTVLFLGLISPFELVSLFHERKNDRGES
jgi:hypothetical protein